MPSLVWFHQRTNVTSWPRCSIMSSCHDEEPQRIPTLVHTFYDLLKFSPPQNQYTILSAFILNRGPDYKIISLATGTKCLPFNRLPSRGEALHDSHAEVLARRGFVRWLLEEISRSHANEGRSESWIEPSDTSPGLWRLKSDTEVILYISSLPCKHLKSIYVFPRIASDGILKERWRCIHSASCLHSGSINGVAQIDASIANDV